MNPYFKIQHLCWPIAWLATLILCGCAAQLNQLEEALGPAARDKIQTIGSPDKDCALYKLSLTDTYGIVIGNHIMRLGNDFKSVRIVSQFATGSADNAVVQCARADGTLDNYLFQAESGNKANLYQLDSHSRQPFITNFAGDSAILLQTTGDPNKWLIWTVSAGDVRGPSTGSMQSVFGQAKPGKRAARPKSMPKIRKDNTFKLEEDVPPSKSPAPKNTPAPASEQSAPYKAIETPELD